MSSDHATPFPDVEVFGHEGLGPPPRLAIHGNAGAIIRERGCEVVLHFASAERDAPLLGLWIWPDRDDKQLEPAKARRLVPQLDLYVAAARAALDWNVEDFRPAVEALRQVARPGRGYSEDFSRLIAMDYKALVAGGEKYPVKALGEKHHVDMSTASRWVTQARRRGYLPERQAAHA